MGEPANDNRLRCLGLSRVQDSPKAVMVAFSRPLTDDELRFFHDVCGRTAPLMEDR